MFRRFYPIVITGTLAYFSHATAESSWNLEWSERYWYGEGQYKLNLYDIVGETLYSRLTYSDWSSHAAEGVLQLTHNNGVFIKGYVGGGGIISGHLNDEDFPPALDTYSSTLSPQHYGFLNYLSTDLGYYVIKRENGRLGGYMGFNYLNYRFNTFGCTQVGGNNEVCVPPFPETINTLDNEATINSLRLGLTADLHLNQRLKVSVDAAYVSSDLYSIDYHNLRPDIRGVIDAGVGSGFQLDALLHWFYSPSLSFGIGGRWWQMDFNGNARFEELVISGQPQAISVSELAYGLLMQANYQFDKPIALEPLIKDEPLVSWRGPYIGGNIGYGTHTAEIHMSPDETVNAFTIIDSPLSLRMKLTGFLAGGQLGYNWLYGNTLIGIEDELDYAIIGGSNSVTLATIIPTTTTVSQQFQWVDALKFRLGRQLQDTMLVFVETGPAWGSDKLAFARNIDMECCEELNHAITIQKTLEGIDAGAGLEFAITPEMSFKFEYVYFKFPKFSTYSRGYDLVTMPSLHTLRVGINYKFQKDR